MEGYIKINSSVSVWPLPSPREASRVGMTLRNISGLLFVPRVGERRVLVWNGKYWFGLLPSGLKEDMRDHGPGATAH